MERHVEHEQKLSTHAHAHEQTHAHTHISLSGSSVMVPVLECLTESLSVLSLRVRLK